MPSTTAPAPASERVAFRLPVQLADQLRAIAAREHNGLSPVARRLISAGLDAERARQEHR